MRFWSKHEGLDETAPYRKPIRPGFSVESNSLSPREVGSVPKIVSGYDQEIPQSQTADNPMAPRGRATQPSQDSRKTN